MNPTPEEIDAEIRYRLEQIQTLADAWPSWRPDELSWKLKHIYLRVRRVLELLDIP